ncbi:MAG: PAS domain S-box protein [Candidatus Micrarchaeota archaeon]
MVRRRDSERRRSRRAIRKPSEGVSNIPKDMVERDLAEVAIRDSETRYRRLFETAQDGILLLDADTGQITDVNPFLISMLGYTHREFLGKKLWEVGPFKDIFANKAKFFELQKKGYIRYENLPLQTKSGEPKAVEFVSNTYRVDHTKVIQCNIRDITDRKKAEIELAKSQALLETLMTKAPVGFAFLDKQFRFIRINDALAEMNGIPVKKHLGRTMAEILPALPTVLPVFKKVLKGESFIGVEVHGETPAFPGIKRTWLASYYPVTDSSGYNLGVGVVAAEITERKKFESDILREKDRIRKYLDLVGVIVVALDPSGKVILINKKGCDILGYTEHEILGQDWFRTFLPKRMRKSVLESFAKIKSGKMRNVTYYENPILTRGGEERLIQWHNINVMEKGRFMYSLSSGEDITERKRNEEAMRRKNRVLALISACNKIIVHCSEETELVREICRVFVETGGYRMAWFGCAEEGGRKRVIPIASNGFEKGFLKTANITWANTVWGRGPDGTAVRTGRPSIAQDILKDRRFAPWRKGALSRGYASSLALPILLDGKRYGALVIYSERPDAFDADEVRLLEEMAEDLAYGISALKAKKALEESEKTFAAIFNNATDIVIYLDSSGKILKISQSVNRIWGYTPAEIAGKRFNELTNILSPDTIAVMSENFKNRLSGTKITPYIVEARTVLGKRVFAEVRGSVLSVGERITGAVITLSDMTERISAEKRLMTSYRVASALSTGGSISDTFPVILRTICTNLGWDWGEIWTADAEKKRFTLTEFWHGASKKYSSFIKISLKTQFKSGLGLPGHVWARGKPLWLEEIEPGKVFLRASAARKVGFKSSCAIPIKMGDEVVGAMLFLSEEKRSPDPDLLQSLDVLGSQIGQFIKRKSTELSLLNSETRFRSVFEHGSIGILLGAPDHRFIKVNPAASRIFGYGESELRGMTFKDLTHPEYFGHDIEQIKLIEEGRIPFFTAEKQYIRKDGTTIWGSVKISVIRDSNDNVLYYLAMVDDITEQKNNEDMLRSQRDQLEKLSKVKERFMADMTHELKTPLSVILLNLNLAHNLDQRKQKREYEQCFDLMWRNAMRLSRSIEQIMRLTSTDSVEVCSERFSIDHIMRSVFQDYVPLAHSKGIDLQASGSEIGMEGDPRLLAMAVSNLVSNAIKFTDRGHVHLTWVEAGGDVIITVTDSGIGISKENHQKIFNLFFKENYDAPGSGIGLPITRSLIERMGGRIEFKSKKGQGSTFTITIPKVARK